jgi:hypothetical protein
MPEEHLFNVWLMFRNYFPQFAGKKRGLIDTDQDLAAMKAGNRKKRFWGCSRHDQELRSGKT